ncbi:hypothetical protein LPJ66_009510 [Kickxella alabastrina]|uniref:Uncharacterized protein n=1 Tax=Kickxella alabastrina TaxID=61397 RepID=A0ACC1I3N5_9FUNG|nr:hypothetical protein LPJ66_009510 [Kickxella alabastrina]
MLASSAKLALAVTAIFAATSVNGQSQCQAGATQCGTDNESVLLRCNKGTWTTEYCGANQYCMTMNKAMIHCMLKPDDGSKTTFSESQSTPTSQVESSSDNEKSTNNTASTSLNKESSSSGASGNGNMVVAAAAVGIAVAGMVAFF